MQFSRSFRAQKNSRFQAKSEILAVFYSEWNGDFVKLIKFWGVIGTLRLNFNISKLVYYVSIWYWIDQHSFFPCGQQYFFKDESCEKKITTLMIMKYHLDVHKNFHGEQWTENHIQYCTESWKILLMVFISFISFLYFSLS